MTAKPKSASEDRHGFVFDASQLMELADEALLCSEAAPQSEARLVEGVARLAAAAGFLGATLIDAGWTPDRLSRLIGSASAAGAVVFHETAREAEAEAARPTRPH